MLKKVILKATLVVFLFFGASVIPSTSLFEQQKYSTMENDGTLSGYVTSSWGDPLEGALIRVHFHETYESGNAHNDRKTQPEYIGAPIRGRTPKKDPSSVIHENGDGIDLPKYLIFNRYRADRIEYARTVEKNRR